MMTVVPSPAPQNGMTPLHFASRFGHAAVVELLLSLGASLTECDAKGKNPLEFAMENGRRFVAAMDLRVQEKMLANY